MSRRHVPRSLAIGVVSIVAAACSPAEDDRSPVIDMVAGNQFAPAGAMVRVGDHVLWSNHDDHAHRLELGDGGSITVQPGDVVQTTFSREGVVLVHDTAATQMLAVIEVLPR